MSNYSTNEFRSGLKLMLDHDPVSIIENDFVKSGKGQAFRRVKFRNLKTGRVIERTFKSGESFITLNASFFTMFTVKTCQFTSLDFDCLIFI